MATQPEKKDGYPLTRTTVSTAFLIACSCLTLTSCQAPEPGTGPAGRETTPTDASGTPSVGAVPDLSSATSNADGSPIVFDPVEAGKNLPDPCTELPAATLNEIGFKSDYERFTIGLDDTLPGKAISCDLSLIDMGFNDPAFGFYSDNLSREYLLQKDMFIENALESRVPNAYFYTYAPDDQSFCCIGVDTHRGRFGLLAGGYTKWTWQESCPSVLKYFDQLYEVTDGFSWLES
ncbi:hypothetical protein OS125_03185 [Corynebacterium sp. P7003]|uniref:DUF3558 domain-containing protein n=1 Tax=Corynebacterium pygosceleis TaxID=2800406 RepID=A0ABT3WPR0_9CORY|nr:hypothetical protein [Corynebacterium pygosceleis]MCX7444250.1 hypothetical protein [Corynebacterium pygosceleis]